MNSWTVGVEPRFFRSNSTYVPVLAARLGMGVLGCAIGACPTPVRSPEPRNVQGGATAGLWRIAVPANLMVTSGCRANEPFGLMAQLPPSGVFFAIIDASAEGCVPIPGFNRVGCTTVSQGNRTRFACPIAKSASGDVAVPESGPQQRMLPIIQAASSRPVSQELPLAGLIGTGVCSCGRPCRAHLLPIITPSGACVGGMERRSVRATQRPHAIEDRYAQIYAPGCDRR